MSELRTLALEALVIGEPDLRCRAVDELSETLPLDPERSFASDRPVPGRPVRPRLVPIHEVPARNPRTADGHAALLHSIAHIEFNAIGLALDAIWRFAGHAAGLLPRLAAGRAWRKRVTSRLLPGILRRLAHAYGDFDAHDGLWDMAARTAGDVLDRMALVPRTARSPWTGRFAGDTSQARSAAGDPTAAAILDVILRDEIGHVGDWQPLVQLALQRARARSGGHGRRHCVASSRAATARTIQPGSPARCRFLRRGNRPAWSAGGCCPSDTLSGLACQPRSPPRGIESTRSAPIQSLAILEDA